MNIVIENQSINAHPFSVTSNYIIENVNSFQEAREEYYKRCPNRKIISAMQVPDGYI